MTWPFATNTRSTLCHHPRRTHLITQCFDVVEVFRSSPSCLVLFCVSTRCIHRQYLWLVECWEHGRELNSQKSNGTALLFCLSPIVAATSRDKDRQQGGERYGICVSEEERERERERQKRSTRKAFLSDTMLLTPALVCVLKSRLLNPRHKVWSWCHVLLLDAGLHQLYKL